MEIFGIGPLEFILIVVIMLLVLGPKEMVATAGKIGRFIRQVVRSPIWGTVMQTSKDVRDLPNRIIREAGLEQEIAQIKEVAQTQSAMMNEVAKQLQVQIPPIEMPKVLTSPSSISSAATPSQVASPAAPLPATPLEIEPIIPFATESTATGALPYIPEAGTSLQADFSVTTPPPQPEETGITQAVETDASQTVQAPEGIAAPLIVEAPVSSIPETPVAIQKPKRSRAKPIPLETETLVVVEPAPPHENGGSANSG